MIFVPVFSDSSLPLAEYPRPQMRRDSYFPLNGVWQYSFASPDGDAFPCDFDGEILVPYSPESALSGVGRQLRKEQRLLYRRSFALPEGFNRGRVLLNTGACDQVCAVFVNRRSVGSHAGGYTPFSLDITDAIRPGENELVYVVRDDADSDVYGRGKQKYERGGIWYTATSGIWQSVWLESVPPDYIRSFRLDPDYDRRRLSVSCSVVGTGIVTVRVLDGGAVVAEGRADSPNSVELDVSGCKDWSPERPELYDVEILYGGDRVESYFGLRKFSVVRHGKHKYFALNNSPVFHNGLLDQGYWHDGLYTPPSNRAMYEEIKAVKELGYNMLRKHIKVEPLLWYYYCDILGVFVWQDLVNGGLDYPFHRIALLPFVSLPLDDTNRRRMGRSDESCRQYYAEAAETMDTLYNCVSLCLWTPFNEAWGQFDSLAVWKTLRERDSSRLFDHASGWVDKGGGDVCSRHVYFRKVRLRNDRKRVLALTEFGGYSWAMDGHTFSKKLFGYRMCSSRERLMSAIESLYTDEILPLIEKQGLSAAVYTELTDVEDEMNGIFTFDRVVKVDARRIKEMNARLYKVFGEVFG